MSLIQKGRSVAEQMIAAVVVTVLAAAVGLFVALVIQKLKDQERKGR